jgi:divalent metal cation (Fe/Co/Zn/Cd) transporter
VENRTLLKKALFYEYVTIGWNIMEGIVCVTIGLLIHSVSLMAYGLESSIEVFASSVVVWDLRESKNTEKKALFAIGFAYLVVSVYIFYDALKSIFEKQQPHVSIPGIIFMFATLIVMLTLGLIKKNIGKQMKSKTVLADAKFTLIDGALSGAVLIGLLCNALFGWWWMDQFLALVLAGVALREGLSEVL